MNPEKLELRSEAVRTILAAPPSNLVRWGTSSCLLAVLVLVALTVIIKYPDVVSAPVQITTEIRPAVIAPSLDGKIEKLYVKEGKSVKTGDTLALISSTARHEDMRVLENALNAFYSCFLANGTSASVLPPFEIPENALVLGDVQKEYEAFRSALQQYEQISNEVFSAQNLGNLEDRLSKYQSLAAKMESQKALLEEQNRLASEKFETDQKLFEKGAGGINNVNESKKAFLDSKMKMEENGQEKIRIQVEASKLSESTIKIRQGKQQGQADAFFALNEKAGLVAAALKTWKAKYLLVSPIAGKVVFYKQLNAKEYVKAGEEVLQVLPPSEGLFCVAYIKPGRMGKVKLGQKTRIKFEAYPYKEYGIVNGVVKAVSPLTQDGRYKVSVALPDGLVTNYDLKLGFTQEMPGQAEIITEDLRMIERFFYRLRYLFSQK